MFQKKIIPILICIALLSNGVFSFAQDAKTEPFDKLKVRGAILINYHVSNETGIQIIDSRNEGLVKTSVKNNKIVIKHLKIKPNQNKQVEINIWGSQLMEVAASQLAVIKSDSVVLADTAKVCLASGSELQTKVKSSSLNMNISSGSFGYLEGSVNTLKLKVKTGSKFRAHKATISKAVVKIATGGFAALQGETDVEGKVITGGELKFYGKANEKKIKRHTHGVISQSEADEL